MHVRMHSYACGHIQCSIYPRTDGTFHTFFVFTPKLSQPVNPFLSDFYWSWLQYLGSIPTYKRARRSTYVWTRKLFFFVLWSVSFLSLNGCELAPAINILIIDLFLSEIKKKCSKMLVILSLYYHAAIAVYTSSYAQLLYWFVLG